MSFLSCTWRRDATASLDHSGIDINDEHNSFRHGPLVIAGLRADRVRVLPSRPEIKLPAHGGHACSPNRVSGSRNRRDLEQYQSIGTPPDPARNFPTRPRAENPSRGTIRTLLFVTRILSSSHNTSEPEVVGIAPSFCHVSAKPSYQHRNTHQNRCALAPKKLRSFIGLNIDSFSIASSRIGHNSHTATFRRSRAAFSLPHHTPRSLFAKTN